MDCGATVGLRQIGECRVRIGLPVTSSRELLEILNDDRRKLSFRVIGREHRFANYWSTGHTCLLGLSATSQ
jgi:abscisic acid receptor (PYR/PYL family)